jgi:hypothetical protein
MVKDRAIKVGNYEKYWSSRRLQPRSEVLATEGIQAAISTPESILGALCTPGITLIKLEI